MSREVSNIRLSLPSCLALPTTSQDLNPNLSIFWEAPPIGLFKLNCDVVVVPVGKVTCGGVLRDHSETVVFAFSNSTRTCSIKLAELWAI